MEKVTAIIPAAGEGKRLGLGFNKAFALLRGVPLIVHCLRMLERTHLVERAVVVLAPGEADEGKMLLQSYAAEHFPALPFDVVAGGRQRQDSVANALRSISADAGFIAVHDGARPFAGRAVFARTLAAALVYGAAIAAVPVKNTIKIVDADGKVVATPDRSTLQAVQTPQIFEAHLLKRAYANLAEHPAAVTDDASVVEMLGHKVVVAMGRYENIKITTPEDLVLAENLLAQQELEDGEEN